MAKRKYTRKQLRQPDEFISLSMKVWEFVRENAPRVLITLGVALVILAAAWAWTHFSDARAGKATTALSRAFDIYAQPVTSAAGKQSKMGDDGIPRFSTESQKLRAAETEFTAVHGQARGDLRWMAVLMRARVRYELGQYDQALADYQLFLANNDREEFRFNALEGIAYCYEARKQWDKALESFRKLPTDGDNRWRVAYHEARVLTKQGQPKQAGQLLHQIIEKAGSRALQDLASDQLALLEVK